MVHKRYIKSGGKVYGPYFYKSIRTKDGKVKNIYLGEDYHEAKNYHEIKKESKSHKYVVQKKEEFQPAYENMALRVMLAVFLVGIAGVMGYLGFNSITGYYSYEPLSGNLLLEDMGEQTIHAGQQYNMSIRTDNFGGNGVLFKDDSDLFDISGEGRISFTAKNSDAGVHQVAIIAKDSSNQSNVLMKIVRFAVVDDE